MVWLALLVLINQLAPQVHLLGDERQDDRDPPNKAFPRKYPADASPDVAVFKASDITQDDYLLRVLVI